MNKNIACDVRRCVVLYGGVLEWVPFGMPSTEHELSTQLDSDRPSLENSMEEMKRHGCIFHEVKTPVYACATTLDKTK